MRNIFIVSVCVCILAVLTSFFNPEVGFIIGGIGICTPLIIAIWNTLK
jgi:hypothetical protein